MPYVQVYVNGNGQVTVQPSNNPSVGELVTVRTYPYTGEHLQDIIFYDNTWAQIGVTQVDSNTWRYRQPDYGIIVVATFSEDSPTPPEPPEPPTPPPTPTDFLSYVIFRRKKYRRLFKY